jgi:hypothetical protein
VDELTAQAAADDIGAHDTVTLIGKMLSQKVEIPALPGQAVDANNDASIAVRAPFDVGNFVELLSRKAVNA